MATALIFYRSGSRTTLIGFLFQVKMLILSVIYPLFLHGVFEETWESISILKLEQALGIDMFLVKIADLRMITMKSL